MIQGDAQFSEWDLQNPDSDSVADWTAAYNLRGKQGSRQLREGRGRGHWREGHEARRDTGAKEVADRRRDRDGGGGRSNRERSPRLLDGLGASTLRRSDWVIWFFRFPGSEYISNV